MIIDILVNGKTLVRYESNIIPRVGETISSFKPEKKCFKVLHIDHLIKPHISQEYMRLELITVNVEEVV